MCAIKESQLIAALFVEGTGLEAWLGIDEMAATDLNMHFPIADAAQI